MSLDEVITTRHRLDEINQGYAGMHAGTDVRGVITYFVVVAAVRCRR